MLTGCGNEPSNGANGSKPKVDAAAKDSTNPPSDSASSGRAASAATLTGTVHFDGTPPKAKKIDLSGTPQCAEFHAEPLYTEKYVVGAEGGVANCFVYVDFPVAEDDDRFPVPAEAAVLDQKDCQYVPHALAIRCNQELKILNSDPVSHNVFYEPKNNESDNIGMPRPDSKTREFPEPDFKFPIRFVCNMHKWMEAWVAVFPHPFFAVTDAQGHFAIAGVPAGKYHVKVWHESKGMIADVEVELPAGGTLDLPAFTLTQ